jgi:hypothetical protein
MTTKLDKITKPRILGYCEIESIVTEMIKLSIHKEHKEIHVYNLYNEVRYTELVGQDPQAKIDPMALNGAFVKVWNPNTPDDTTMFGFFYRKYLPSTNEYVLRFMPYSENNEIGYDQMNWFMISGDNELCFETGQEHPKLTEEFEFLAYRDIYRLLSGGFTHYPSINSPFLNNHPDVGIGYFKNSDGGKLYNSKNDGTFVITDYDPEFRLMSVVERRKIYELANTIHFPDVDLNGETMLDCYLKLPYNIVDQYYTPFTQYIRRYTVEFYNEKMTCNFTIYIQRYYDQDSDTYKFRYIIYNGDNFYDSNNYIYLMVYQITGKNKVSTSYEYNQQFQFLRLSLGTNSLYTTNYTFKIHASADVDPFYEVLNQNTFQQYYTQVGSASIVPFGSSSPIVFEPHIQKLISNDLIEYRYFRPTIDDTGGSGGGGSTPSSDFAAATELTANQDLIQIYNPGYYFMNNNVSTIRSKPAQLTSSFTMIVFSNGTNHPLHYYIKDSYNILYHGYYNGSTINWKTININTDSDGNIILPQHTHNATDVIESSTKRFVTDTQISTWNAASSLIYGTAYSSIPSQVVLEQTKPVERWHILLTESSVNAAGRYDVHVKAQVGMKGEFLVTNSQEVASKVITITIFFHDVTAIVMNTTSLSFDLKGAGQTRIFRFLRATTGIVEVESTLMTMQQLSGEGTVVGDGTQYLGDPQG